MFSNALLLKAPTFKQFQDRLWHIFTFFSYCLFLHLGYKEAMYKISDNLLWLKLGAPAKQNIPKHVRLYHKVFTNYVVTEIF